jgi:hypothetical protein
MRSAANNTSRRAEGAIASTRLKSAMPAKRSKLNLKGEGGSPPRETNYQATTFMQQQRISNINVPENASNISLSV